MSENFSQKSTPPRNHDKDASFIAQKYGVTDRHITSLANSAEIPGVKLGTVWRFNEDEVHEALVSRSRTVRKPKVKAEGAAAK